MGLAWNPWALPNLSLGTLTVLIALFLLEVGRGRRVNRLLATVFIFHGLAWISLGALYSHDAPNEVRAAQTMFNLVLVPGILLYPSFMGHALRRSPAILRTPAFLWVSLVLAAAYDALLLFRSDWAVAGIVTVPFAWYDTVPGPLMVGYLVLAMLVALVGLALSIRERLGTEPGTPERARANAFLLGFGIQDAVFFGAPLAIVATPSGAWLSTAANVAAGAIGSFAASVLVTYGILRHQLFGIEVRLRFAISRSAVAAVFVTVFFVASEGAQILFGAGNAWVGLLAAGALVFALAPLQRAAERLAERAVPVSTKSQMGASPIGAARGEASYRKAVRLAMRDRRITREEEGHLHELARDLGIDGARAHAILVEVENEAEAR